MNEAVQHTMMACRLLCRILCIIILFDNYVNNSEPDVLFLSVVGMYILTGVAGQGCSVEVGMR